MMLQYYYSFKNTPPPGQKKQREKKERQYSLYYQYKGEDVFVFIVVFFPTFGVGLFH